MGVLSIIGLFTRVIILLVAMVVIRRSFEQLTSPTAPNGRARLLVPLGLVVGAIVLLGVFRSCVPFRL